MPQGKRHHGGTMHISQKTADKLPLLLAAVAGIGVSFALTMVLFREKDIEI